MLKLIFLLIYIKFLFSIFNIISFEMTTIGEWMALSHSISVEEALSLWALSCIACGVTMLDRAFGDRREWERGDYQPASCHRAVWATLQPVSLCVLSLCLSWSPLLSDTDGKCFDALALSPWGELTKPLQLAVMLKPKQRDTAVSIQRWEKSVNYLHWSELHNNWWHL